jgi:hypothetical protein
MPEMPQGGTVGRTKGRVHAVFHKRLEDLRLQAKQAHNAIQGKHQRIWQIPSDYSGNLLDIAKLHTPSFEREPINANYETATASPQSAGTNGDVIALKLQIDYNACEERAFRARHTSLCRAMCLGHGRRIGQGHGNVWDNKDGIEGVVSAYISAGGVPSGGVSGGVSSGVSSGS